LKRVNDEQGHAAGDRLLRGVGVALRNGLRSYDVVVRYGGDEFVCALPNVSITAAMSRFNDVSELLAAAILDATVSVGLVAVADSESLDDAIARADRELYAGRNASTAAKRPTGKDG
jgi:diguanylate cyclase (GGDEF)-like protein